MGPKILVTGAAGYIGGSIVADLLSRHQDLADKAHVTAAVRSQEQAASFQAIGVNVIRLDLRDEKAVLDAVTQNEIDIIIQTASSIDPELSFPLISALAARQKSGAKQVAFIHSSGLSAFYERTGWPASVTKDTEGVFAAEKESAESFPLRKTDVSIIEYAESKGVKTAIVIPSTVYGKGSGPWNQLSIVIPLLIKAYIKEKKLYKFPEDVKVSAVHITDLTDLYAHIIRKISSGEHIPTGKEGYYFALAHDITWSEFAAHVGPALQKRGLISDTHLQIWPSDDFAAEAVGIPLPFVNAFYKAGENIKAKIPFRIGWKPKWDRGVFFARIDEEIQTVLEVGSAKSSLVDSLWAAAKHG